MYNAVWPSQYPLSSAVNLKHLDGNAGIVYTYSTTIIYEASTNNTSNQNIGFTPNFHIDLVMHSLYYTGSTDSNHIRMTKVNFGEESFTKSSINKTKTALCEVYRYNASGNTDKMQVTFNLIMNFRPVFQYVGNNKSQNIFN